MPKTDRVQIRISWQNLKKMYDPDSTHRVTIECDIQDAKRLLPPKKDHIWVPPNRGDQGNECCFTYNDDPTQNYSFINVCRTLWGELGLGNEDYKLVNVTGPDGNRFYLCAGNTIFFTGCLESQPDGNRLMLSHHSNTSDGLYVMSKFTPDTVEICISEIYI